MERTKIYVKAYVAAMLLLLTTACMDDRYDLNGGVSTDIHIPNNKLSMPLGDVKAQRLDFFLGAGQDILTLDENGYGICVKGDIDTISFEIDRITLPADTFQTDKAFSLGDLHLNAVEVPGFTETIDMNFSKVKWTQMDEDLPIVVERTSLKFTNPDFDALIKELTAEGLQQRTFNDMNAYLNASERHVPCGFSSRLPKELKTLKRIELCEKGSGESTWTGAAVNVTLNHPARMNGMERTFDFDVIFPAEFELASDDTATETGTCSLEKGMKGHHNIIRFRNVKAEGPTSVLRFRLMSLEDMEEYHVMTDGVSVIEYIADFSYNLDYMASGDLTLSATDDVADYSVGVTIHSKLGIADADITMNPIYGNLSTEVIPFDACVNDVSHVSSVGTLTFVPEKSRLTLTTATDKSFEGFTLDASEPAVVQLPTNFHLNLVDAPATAAWDSQTNMLTLSSLDDLLGATYVFEVTSVDLNATVTDGILPVSGEISVSTKNGVWRLFSTATRLSDIMKNLGSRSISLTLEPTTLTIDDVDVRTEEIVETVNDTSVFEIDVPLDIDIIEKVYALWPEEDVELSLNLAINGLEKTDVEVVADVLLTIPPFICMESDDPQVTVNGNTLRIVTTLDAKNCTLEKKLRVTQFDFTLLEGGYLAPVIVDGETRLQYSSALIAEGNVKVPATEVALSQLADDLSLHASISYNEITPRMFEGVLKYAPDPVENTLEIASDNSLSEMLNEMSLTLSNPQFAVSLTNPIGVPLLVDLLIEGLDENGTVIAGSVITLRDVPIHAASFNPEKNTTKPLATHLLFATHDVAVEGYETVVVPGLMDLLKVIPHALRLKLTPRADGSVTHHVDFLQPVELAGTYKLSVPLQFDELHLKYETKDNDIEVSFGDFSSYLSKASMSLTMNARNTIPIGLKLTFIPLDAEGRELTFIHVSSVQIPAGDGSPISRDSKVTEVEFTFTADNADFTRLARLRVCAEAFANHTEGGIALRPEQGILFTDLVLSVIADVETTLN